jgi:hypothetical protein
MALPRRGTGHSTVSMTRVTRAVSLLTRTQTNATQPPPSELKEHYFPIYRLPWPRLEARLEEAFPDLKGTFKADVSLRCSGSLCSRRRRLTSTR